MKHESQLRPDFAKATPGTQGFDGQARSKKKLILFDAHAIIHRAYHALPEFATSKGEPTGALYGLSSMLIKIIGDLKPEYMAACFDLPGPTYRHEAYENYKVGRKKLDEALSLQIERAKDLFAAFGISIYASPGFEADDILGTIVKEIKGSTLKVEIIIASGDMDTLQLVNGKEVQVYMPKKGLSETILYDEKKVRERFGFDPKLLPDYKGFRGDPSDNIMGVKGIGEKTAMSLVSTFGTVEEIYKALKKKGEGYKEAGINERVKNLLLENEEEAVFSKTLATIRDDAPIHFVLPNPWRDDLNLEKLLNLFQELEFRTMGERVKSLLGKEERRHQVTTILSSPGDDREVREICLALWVIDSNLTNPTLEEVFRFTKTKTLKKAWKVINNQLDERSSREVFEKIERPLIDIVDQMNKWGIKIDKKLLQELSEKYHHELAKLEGRIWKEAGQEFNINSPKALGAILFDKLNLGERSQKKTPGGAISTKESELVKLKDKHSIIDLILAHRELQKLLSTYIDTIPIQLDKDGRLHSTFLQSGTTTGRMSSTNPNLQNIPVKTDLGKVIRHAFIAEKGFKLISFDYSQIELRIAAILSGDKKLVEIFRNKEDVHAGVASRVFKVPIDKVDREMRRRAKIINFGILFGMGVNALKINLGTERQEAQEFYNKYFETFTGLANYLEKIKAGAQRRGYTETLFGRRRYFSGFRSPLPYVRAQAERMAINAPIQGTEADVLKIVMKRIDDYIKEEGHETDIKLLLQVHDELVYEVREDLTAEAMDHLKRIMEKAITEEKTAGVPIVVEAHEGDNWGEMKE